MRLSDLLKRDTVTEDGQELGKVHDVRFTSDNGHWSVESLIVGPRSLAVRLGYSRGVVQGPALLNAAFSWLGRHGRRVPWDAVVRIDDRIVVRGSWDDFASPTAPSDGGEP